MSIGGGGKGVEGRWRFRHSNRKLLDSKRFKEGAWQIKNSRREAKSFQDKLGPNRYSHSIFVEGIPEKATAIWLRNMFQEAGQLVDIFIPRKRARSGNRFAFIRFRTRWEAEKAVKMFDGRIVAGKRFLTNMEDNGIRRQVWRRKGEKNTFEEHNQERRESYTTRPFLKECRAIEVKAEDECLDKMKKSIIGLARKPFEVAWLLEQFESEDWRSIWITRISELQYVIGFNEESLRDELEKNGWERLREWFEEIKPWSLEQEIGERITTISIQGLPLVLWNAYNIDVISKQWGRRCKVNDPLSIPGDARNCLITVATKQSRRIEEDVVLCFGQLVVTVRCSETQASVIKGKLPIEEEATVQSSGGLERSNCVRKEIYSQARSSPEPSFGRQQMGCLEEGDKALSLNSILGSQDAACSAVGAKETGVCREGVEETKEYQELENVFNTINEEVNGNSVSGTREGVALVLSRDNQKDGQINDIINPEGGDKSGFAEQESSQLKEREKEYEVLVGDKSQATEPEQLQLGNNSESSDEDAGGREFVKQKGKSRYFMDINRYMLGCKLIVPRPKKKTKPLRAKKARSRNQINKIQAAKELGQLQQGESSSQTHSVTESEIQRFNSAVVRREEALSTWEIGKKLGFKTQNEEELLKTIESIQGEAALGRIL